MLGRILVIAVIVLLLFLTLSVVTSYIKLRNKLKELEAEKYKKKGD